MSAARVRGVQRWTRERPCPVCGGSPELPHGRGVRCWGYESDDGRFFHCTREEFAGAIDKHPNSDTYPHRSTGDCRCGQRHGEAHEPTFRVHVATAGQMPREVERYHYRDEARRELYSIRRFDPKDFRPYEAGKSQPGLNGTRRVLYLLPELLAADHAATVFVSESQKDADRLVALGLVATANDGGAKNTRLFRDADYCAPLRDRRVVIIQHNDDDGKSFAATVATLLRPVAASVGILTLPNLPPHGDVCDWLDAGGTAAELQRLANALAAESAPASRWVGLSDVLNARPPAWLVEGILPCDATAVLGGRWGTFKSFLALDLALCVATGRDWGGKAVRQGAAAYIVAEGYGGFGPRVRAWLTANQTAPEDIPVRFLPAAPNLQDSDAVGEVLAELVAFPQPPALVVVDTLARTNIGGEENSAKDMGVYFDACQQIQRATGACVLVLHHPTKAGDALRGSGAIAGAAETIIVATRQENGDTVRVHCIKQKDAAEFAPLRFRRHVVELGDDLTSIVLRPHDPLRVASEPANAHERQAFAALVRLGKRATFGAWQEESGIAKTTFSRAVNGLEIGGLVDKRGRDYVVAEEALEPNLEPIDGEGVEPWWNREGQQ